MRNGLGNWSVEKKRTVKAAWQVSPRIYLKVAERRKNN